MGGIRGTYCSTCISHIANCSCDRRAAKDQPAPARAPEAPTACPFNLPLAVGTAFGRVPDQIFDARDQAVLILYAVDSKGSVDEARTMTWNQNGLARADYVVKAVNEHEGLVQRVAELERSVRDLVQCAKDANMDEQPGYWASIEHAEQIIAKPVDRRKD